jgi:hypothetical protein
MNEAAPRLDVAHPAVALRLWKILLQRKMTGATILTR